MLIEGNSNYNQRFLSQYERAIQIIEENDRDQIDTLGVMSFNLIRYSDFHRNSNTYEALVNSGEIKLIKNHEIIGLLQRLEERYIYINRLEDSHSEVIKLHILPDIQSVLKVNTMEVTNADMIYDNKFQNHFSMLAGLMVEKDGIYQDARDQINQLIELIEIELQ